MSIGEDILKPAVPGLSLADLAIRAIGALILAALLIWAGWKLFFAEGAAQRKSDTVAAETSGRVGQAQGAAGQNAANVIANGAQREIITNNNTRTNYVEITRQPGAGDPVSDAVDAAGRSAVCLRTSAASLPDCIRLREADPN